MVVGPCRCNLHSTVFYDLELCIKHHLFGCVTASINFSYEVGSFCGKTVYD